MTAQRALYIGEKNVSSWSMRAWLALRAKKLPFDERTIVMRDDRDRAQRRQVSPTGRLPVLHDGELVIPDSLAIIEYLEEAYPAAQHPALWPADRGERAHARWLAATMHSGFMGLRNGMSFNLCFIDEDLRAGTEAHADARELLGLWEDALATRRTRPPSAGAFLFGAWGAVDAMFAPAVIRLHAFHVSTSATPRAAKYMTAVLDQPDVATWLTQARQLKPRATY